ncbi:type I 3-dehydroquinate dehydratase [bacterium]|nr:type I 3-dehydroquinate dehydratase [bacterium]
MNKTKLLKRLKNKFSIVASVEGKNLLKTAETAVKLGADIIELRIDSIKVPGRGDSPESHIIDLVKNLRKKLKLPIIATIRSKKDRGIFHFSDKKRLKIFRAILNYVDFVDVEITSSSINKIVIKEAHRKGKLAILSYHNFKTTPSSKILIKYAKGAFNLGADVVKIATMADDLKDVKKLLVFCQSWGKSPIAVISLGKIGAISRIAGFIFGSSLTYGYIKRPLAPGQMSVKDLVEKRRFYYGKRD